MQTIKQTQQVQGNQKNEQRIPMTYEQFLTSLDDSIHAEWVHGEAIVFMPPSIRHQDIVTFLLGLIDGFVKLFNLGRDWTAPCEMRLLVTSTSREPDILFLATSNFGRLSENRVLGPADLVIELVSTESITRDRVEKFNEYQINGVREYWGIDPRPGMVRADFWVLDESGRYQAIPLAADGKYHSTVLPNFKLDVNTLLTHELLDHIQALVDMVGIETMSRKRNSS
jgi:Uma2 family endonuclease